MIRPFCLRLSWAKGFDLQAHSRGVNGLPAVSAARPGPLGNPFVVRRDGGRVHCVKLHAKLLDGFLCTTSSAPIDAQIAHLTFVRDNHEGLRGHNIACWCRLPEEGRPDICHAATLIEFFNR